MAVSTQVVPPAGALGSCDDPGRGRALSAMVEVTPWHSPWGEDLTIVKCAGDTTAGWRLGAKPCCALVSGVRKAKYQKNKNKKKRKAKYPLCLGSAWL